MELEGILFQMQELWQLSDEMVYLASYIKTSMAYSGI